MRWKEKYKLYSDGESRMSVEQGRGRAGTARTATSVSWTWIRQY